MRVLRSRRIYATEKSHPEHEGAKPARIRRHKIKGSR